MSEPYRVGGTASAWTSVGYDGLDRPTWVERPDGTAVRASHLLFSTRMENARGTPTISQRDVEGREIELIEQLVRVEGGSPEPVRTRSYYGAFGHVRWSIDATGNDTVYSVDDYGRVYGIDDPDSEERVYKYNGFDELVTARDPATGLWTTNVRDPLGRIERSYTGDSEDPVEDVLYTWDTTSDPSRGRDLIGAVHSSRRLTYGGLESEHFSFFDDLGRPSADDVVVESTRLTMDYGYDSLSRIRDITYPDPGDGNRYRARYEYQPTDRGGGLRRIEGEHEYQNVTLLSVEGRDLSGRILQEVVGNNQVTRRTYDVMGRLSTVNVRPSGTGTAVLDLRYAYDDDGNITRRTDVGDGAPRTESYVLDSLDRLTRWRVCPDETGTCVGSTALANAGLEYDEGGTLTEVKTRVGGADTLERFGFEPDRPHVPSTYERTGDGLVVLHHDDGGRRIEDGARTIEYTSFDLPRSVSEGGGTLERYSYGPSGDRVRRIDKDGNSVFYHGDAFELRTNAAGTVELGIAHIPGPGGVVASVVIQPNKSVVPLYHHRDALGSAAVTTANAGAVIERPYRDPFGGEVNRSGAPDSNFDTDLLDEGFTGHSLDRATGYIDAEGRMYDPRTRRFLTTDPLAGIGGSQSWDPFSYVRNNPSTLIDPSGFDTIQAQEPPTPNGVGFDTSQTSTSGGGGGSVGGSGGARGTDAPVRIDMTAPNRIVDDGSVTTTRSTGGGDGGLGPAWQTFQNRAFDMMIRGPAAMVTQVYEQTDEDIREIESRGHDTTITRYGLVVVNGGMALATSLAHLPEAVDMIAGDVGRAWETGDPKDIAVAAADTVSILGPRGVTNIARGTVRGGFRASVAAGVGLPGIVATLRALVGRGPPRFVLPWRRQLHHIFPQAFRDIFQERGINIDRYTVEISRTRHLRSIHGRGDLLTPGRYNARWEAFLQTGPNALQIYQFAGRMMDDYGLSGLPIVPYR